MRGSIHYPLPAARAMAAAGCLLFLALPGAKAEERVLASGAHEYALLLTSFLSTSCQTTLSLAAPAAPVARLSYDLTPGVQEMTFEPLFLRGAREKKPSEDPLVLMRRRLPSRFAYDSWAKLQTGYGELFPNDIIGRSRTNGVGIEDSRFLYFKMSFWF